MKLYILIRNWDPSDYDDRAYNREEYGIVLGFFTYANKLGEFVSHKRQMNYQKWMREHNQYQWKFDADSDDLEFDSWPKVIYYVMTVDTDIELWINPEDWVKGRSERDPYEIEQLYTFLHKHHIIIWDPPQHEIDEYNRKVDEKNGNRKSKMDQFKELHNELQKEGLLK